MTAKSNSKSEPVRRWARSGSDRMLGGVCGGIAAGLDVPPAAVRLACVFLTFLSGWTAVMYVIALAVMPRDASGERKTSRTVHSAASAWGFILVCFGLLLLSGWISDHWDWWGGPFGGFWRWRPLPFRLLFPILIILTGVGLWIRGLSGDAKDAKGAGNGGGSGTALFRSPSNRVIAGVCGAVAERFQVDPTLVRLLAVLFTLMTALLPGLLFYLCLWIVIPEKH